MSCRGTSSGGSSTEADFCPMRSDRTLWSHVASRRIWSCRSNGPIAPGDAAPRGRVTNLKTARSCALRMSSRTSRAVFPGAPSKESLGRLPGLVWVPGDPQEVHASLVNSCRRAAGALKTDMNSAASNPGWTLRLSNILLAIVVFSSPSIPHSASFLPPSAPVSWPSSNGNSFSVRWNILMVASGKSCCTAWRYCPICIPP